MAAIIRFRHLILLLFLLASAPTIHAIGTSSQPRKILFVASDPGASVAGVTVLGRLAKGFWVSADHPGALALFAGDSSARILFGSEADYRQRVKALPKARIPARLAWPYDQVDDNAENQLIGGLIDDMRKRLQGLAQAARQAGSQGGRYRACHDSGFRMAGILDPDTRLESWDAFTLLEGVREDLSSFNDEISNLKRRFPDVFPRRDTAMEAARERLIFAIGDAMHRIRPDHSLKPGKVRSPGPDDWVRGIYVTPYDSVMAHPINGEESETAVRWGNGVMTTQEDRNIRYTERRGLQARILFLDGHEFVGIIGAFDSTQWPGIFAKRLKAMTTEYLADHLAGRQYQLILDATNRARYLEKKEPVLAEEISRHLELERRDQMRLAGDFQAARFDPEKLRSGWEAYTVELEFSLAWARLARWAESVPRLERALTLAKDLRSSLK